MNPDTVIQTENLTKYFGSFAGVKDISLEVIRGEIFGFLGPNGAGKTTTIRMLLDLLRPTSGQIRLFGKDLQDNSKEIRRRCGYLPGNFAAYGNLTGNDFLKLCADLRRISRDTNNSLLERFDLSGQNLGRRIKYLSHGTVQKLGIIQAFFHEPELLILDEPTTGLDPLMQEAFYGLLIERQQNGCTIFLSSHNLAEVERVCQRMAIIRKGNIERIDSIRNLRKSLRKRLHLTLKEPLAGLNLSGAELIRQDGAYYEFIVTGDITELLKQLAQLSLADLTLTELGLDEIFINLYKESEDG